MPHPQHRQNITKEELKATHYESKVEEFRRHIRLHRVIRVNYHDSKELFSDLILVLRKLYQAPNKDFSQVNTYLMIDKFRYEIMDYQENKTLELETLAKGQLYNIKYVIKKYWNSYRIHYYDYSLSQKTIFGLKANISKHFYKKAVSKNARIIKKELKILKLKRVK